MSENVAASIYSERDDEFGWALPRAKKSFLQHIPAALFVYSTAVIDYVLLNSLSFILTLICLHEPFQINQYVFVAFGLTSTVSVIFQNNHLYKIELIADYRHAVPRIVKIWTIAFLGLVATGVLTKVSDNYSRSWLISWYFAGLVGLSVERFAIGRLYRTFVRSGRMAHSVVLVGASGLAARFKKSVENNRYGIRVDAVFDDQYGSNNTSHSGLPVNGNLDSLLHYHKLYNIDTVVITLPVTDRERLSKIVRRLSPQPLNIRVLPGDFAFESPRSWYAPLGEVPGIQLMAIKDRPIAHWGYMIKNLVDRGLALFALVLLSPILVTCVVGVKLNSPGPVLFRQKRVGYRNRIFEVYKFRSMHVSGCNTGKLTQRKDPRVYKFGQFMRKLSFDELPQLLNVLRGDMSLVGPRPHMLEAQAAGQFYFDAVSEYASRHRVKPGITGWAQVNGWRGPTETIEQIENRVRHDLYYIDNWSLGLDFVILFRTIFGGFSGENAF